MKETFILRTEWMDFILNLSNEDQAVIMQNIFFYHSGQETKINLKNPQVNLVWNFIEPIMKRNSDAYDRRCETSKENGRLGGRPRNLKKPNSKPKKPIETLSDYDCDIDSDSVIDTVTDVASQQKEKYKKKKIADAVSVTDDEEQKLKVKFGDRMTEAVEILNNYKMQNGKRYKSDYHALIGWVSERIQKTVPAKKIYTPEEQEQEIDKFFGR